MMLARWILAGLLAAATLPALAVGTLTTLGAGPGASSSACADPNWLSVVALVGNDNGTNGTSTFLDKSSKVHTFSTKTGLPVWSTTQVPTGLTTSISLPAASIQSANSADWQFGAGNWTVEGYAWSAGWSAQAIVTTMGTSGTPDELLVRGDGLMGYSSNTSAWDLLVTAAPTFANNTWQHFAFYRSGTTFFFALGGVVQNLGTSATTALATSFPLFIGSTGDPTWTMNGFVASIRVTKGVARYGAGNFTPPTLPLPAC